MEINSQDRAITETTLQGAVRVGYRNGRLSAKYRSRLIRAKLKLEAPKRKTVRGMTTRHGIRGLFRPVWLSWSTRRRGTAIAPWSKSATARLSKRKLQTVRSLLFHKIAKMTKKLPKTATAETVIIKVEVTIVASGSEVIFSLSLFGFKVNFCRMFPASLCWHFKRIHFFFLLSFDTVKEISSEHHTINYSVNVPWILQNITHFFEEQICMGKLFSIFFNRNECRPVKELCFNSCWLVLNW